MRVNSNSWDNSLNLSYLYDADAFFQLLGFDSDSRAHFHSKSSRKFIYFNIIECFFTHGKSV